MSDRSERMEFLERVAKAAFANPFSDERVQLEREISGLSEGATSDRLLEVTLERVRAVLEELEVEGSWMVGRFDEPERSLVRVAHLFDVFHRFVPEIDGLIRRQVGAAEGICPAPFWRDAVAEMERRGIGRSDALRYFAVFFQLRRAYYFIQCSLVGRSSSMKGLRRALWNNVFTLDVRMYERHLWSRMEDFSTLILGETGTGKGAAAAAIGRSGFIPFDPRNECFEESFTRSYTSLNLSQFPEALIESELFGHRKGAFTGAVEAHEGIFARCSPHGAIFLDEIGDASIPVQIKLLQVLQERVFSPVGSHEKRRFHGRVVAATNRPIDRLRQEGLFRDDFYYRLCSDVITVPPLRRRLAESPGELDDLIVLTVRRLVGEEAPDVVGVVTEALGKDPGPGYAWPGNVRELEQAVRRVLLTGRYGRDTAGMAPDLAARLRAGVESGRYAADALLADYCALLHRRHGTYEEVSRRVGLDRRTVKKYVQSSEGGTHDAAG